MSFLDDMVTRLVAQGVGVLNVNIFPSSSAVVPSPGSFPVSDLTKGMGPYLSIGETGGTSPTRVQNAKLPNTQRPSAQVIVRAGRIASVQEAYATARAMAWLAYQALDGNFNVTIGSAFYISVMALQEPTDMGIDVTTMRAQVVFNISAEKSAS